MSGVKNIDSIERLDQLEQNLKERSDLLNSILSAAAVGIGMVIDRVLMEVNPFLCNMLGYEAVELVGQNARFLYPSDEEFKKVGKIKYEQIDALGKGSIETKWLTKDGEILDILLSSVPIDTSDLSVGVTFTALNITEKKQAERDLKIRSDFERLITGISTRFINLPAEDLEKTLNSALFEICEFTRMDRGCILTLSEDQSVMNHLCMFTSKDDPFCDYVIPPIPTDKMQWWMNILRRNDTYTMTSLDEIPASEKYLRKFREAAGVKSQVDVPVMQHGKLIGSIGLVCTQTQYSFPDQYIALIRVFAEIVSNALQRKQMEQKLQLSEEKHRKIFQNIQDVYFEMAVDTTILEVSPSVSKMSKYTREELIGQSIEKLVVDEKIKNTFLDLLFHRGELLDFDVPLVDKDGRVVYCSVNVKIENDEKGKPVKVIGSLRDITERRMAREKISKLERAVEQSPSSVVITDLEGNIEYVNPKFCEVTGYSREEAVGHNPRILKSGDQESEFYLDLWKTIKSGNEWRGEFHNMKKDGTTYWEMASISPVRNHLDEITHYIAIKEDITDRKISEQQLQEAKEKAEESDRLKSAFLANMSHEIRTPMNAILGFSELLKNSNIPEPDRQEYIKLINTKGNDLMMIISDLIDISRIEAGDMKLANTNIRVNDLITELFEQTKKEKDLREKELVQIRKNISEEAEPIILSDKNRLRQVFTNLLSNALKFTNEGYIEIGYDIREEFVHFYVRDTGIGIAVEKQDIIFERFRQADDSYTRKYGGTGLGLAISKQIIELLGGEIRVESNPGQGSTFWFSIQLKEIGKKHSGLPDLSEIYAAKVLDLKNRTILIAEDDPSNYLFLESLLRPTKAELIWARDGNQAVEIHSKKGKIDLILMDIRMPSLNGLLATEKIRILDKKTPIIALTAFAFNDDRLKSGEAGCNEHITKPVKIEELKHVLMKYLA